MTGSRLFMRTSIRIMKKCTGTGSKSDKKQIKPTPLQEPHVLSAEDVLQNHATSAGQGLSAAEAAQRGHTHGPNELAETARKPPGLSCWTAG